MNRERKNIEKAKNIALVASVILGMICCSTSVYARQSKRNESISFYGEKKYSNVLNSSFGDGEESIIGTDDREMIANTKKAPYKYIGKLEVGYESGKSDEGTGFLVGKSLVLTAAHCVYEKGENIKFVDFYPGQDGNNLPYGGYEVLEVHIPTKYKEGVKNNDELTKNKYDYALLELKEDVGDKLGYFKLGGYNTKYNIDNLTNQKMVLTGYPEKKMNRLYKHKGTVSGFNSAGYLMYYNMDTTNGQSGSPVYKYMDGKYYVVGIHTRHSTRGNCARYITKNVYELVKKYE